MLYHGNGMYQWDTWCISDPKTGIVHAYDIQEQAIINTKNLTKDFDNIIFHLETHENINQENENNGERAN